MARYLLAYDGSEHARKALDKAVDMADPENDEIVVLYVIPAAQLDKLLDVGPDVTRKEARGIVNQAVETINARGRKAMAVVREGNVAEEIVNFAGELECSLILIGSKGLSKIGRFALGSVAESVARNAECGVLIIK